MTYELAKELKKAGFPLHETHISAYKHSVWPGNGSGIFGCMMCGFPIVEIEGKLYMMPLLSELIAACGMGFELERFDMFERDTFYKAKTVFASAEGSTPEEAVARLWLALNKK